MKPKILTIGLITFLIMLLAVMCSTKRIDSASEGILVDLYEAEKQANELRQSSLTPLLIQEKFIEKWDGKSSLYGNAPIIFKNVN